MRSPFWLPVLLSVTPPLLAQVPMGPQFVVAPALQCCPASYLTRVASAPDGRFVVVWDASDGSHLGVFGRAFGADSSPRGAEFQVNGYTTGYQSSYWDHAAVAFGDDGFVVVWPSRPQDGDGYGVFGQRFDASGARLGGEFRVNTQTTLDQDYPAVAMAPDGRFMVVWRDSQWTLNRVRILGQRYDAAGNPDGGEFAVSSTLPEGAIVVSDVAMDTTGNSVVVWNDSSCANVRGQRFDAAGNPSGGEFVVAALTTGCPWRPQVAMAPDGRFVVSWPVLHSEPRSFDIAARRFDAAGVPLGGELLVNTYTTWVQWKERIAMDADGKFVLTWRNSTTPDDGPLARRYDAAGESVGAEFFVSRRHIYAGMFPDVAADAFGNFVFAWRDFEQVRARRYFGGLVPALLAIDAAGTPSSDGNGVLEACETVGMQPAWQNETAGPLALNGTLSNFTGPSGATYTIADGSGSYSVASGATATCQDCYAVGVSCASPRPALHWDGTVTEALAATPQRKPWALHIGESFTDVPRSGPFYRFVETVLHHSVTTGCGGGAYCPAASVTREQMPVFVLLARETADYLPYECSFEPRFRDVPLDHPFCRWIEELERRGVVSGCGNGNYCPQAPVTREQMAVFILRTLDTDLAPPACTTPKFADVPASSPFCRWIEELARRGIAGGCGDGNYCPADPVTREQMAAFLSIAFGLSLYGPVP